MGDHTAIEWTDATWNPVGGCSVISPGCTNCYSMRIAGSGRLRNHPLYKGTTTESKAGPVFNGTLTASADDHPVWTWPLRWRGSKQPRRGDGARSTIFVDDMADLFHKDRPDEVIDRVFATMALAPQFDFQVLTKRADRMHRYITADILPTPSGFTDRGSRVHFTASPLWMKHKAKDEVGRDCPWPLPNVWLGVSVEDQERADERIPLLLSTPAAVRFISAEPLLGRVNLVRHHSSAKLPWLPVEMHEDQIVRHSRPGNHLDWVIAGGESGPDARPMHPDWIHSLRDQCTAADVPFFFKQWGEYREFDNGLPGTETIEFSDDDREHANTILPLVINPCWITVQGRTFNKPDDLPFDTPCRLMERVGKKRAGALLDGCAHREWPR